MDKKQFGSNWNVKIVQARYEFARKFMQMKGWPTDPRALTVSQINELRSQPGWNNPVIPE